MEVSAGLWWGTEMVRAYGDWVDLAAGLTTVFTFPRITLGQLFNRDYGSRPYFEIPRSESSRELDDGASVGLDLVPGLFGISEGATTWQANP